MSKKILITIIVILILGVGFLLIRHFALQGSSSERKKADEMKKEAARSNQILQNYEQLEKETNKKINSLLK